MTDAILATASQARWVRLTGSPAGQRALAIVEVAGAAALGAAAEGPLWVRAPLLTTVNLFVSLGLIGSGRWLVAQSGQRGTGWALILSGVARPLGWSDLWTSGPGPLYSTVFGYLDTVCAAWALLRYPDERLSRSARCYLAVLAAWLIGGPVAETMLARPGWLGAASAATWWPPTFADRQAFNDVSGVFIVGCAVLTVIFLVLMGQRAVAGDWEERAVRLPVIAAGMVAAVASMIAAALTSAHGASDDVFAVEGMVGLGVPVAFLVSFGQQRLRRMAQLVSGVDASATTVDLLTHTLRTALQDPGLRLLTYSGTDRRFHAPDGHPVEIGDLPPGRTAELVTSTDQRPLAMLVTSGHVGHEQAMLGPAVALTRLALDKLRLAEDKSELSRRLLRADYEARREIVGDLHDGVQFDLVVLKQKLRRMQDSDGEQRTAALAEASELAQNAIDGLHELAHDLDPATLRAKGLSGAVRETADKIDQPIGISIPDGRLPEAVEKTAYFLIREALTNATKHAHATRIDVSVERSGDLVTIRIRDDGVGGADPDGRGIGKLRDRIAAHGGELIIDSPEQEGTWLTATMPCA